MTGAGMKVTFVSNYINHHQIPVSTVLFREFGEGYTFVQTEPMEEERVKMGWGADFKSLPFLKELSEDEEGIRKLISESDVVIFGGTAREDLIEGRLKAGKPVIRYSERIYREGQWKWISPRGLVHKYHDHTRYSNSPVYLLCSGAYVAGDFELVKAYRGKRFRWGYFPEFEPLGVEERKSLKEKEVPEILWVGRFLTLKHPMDALSAVCTMKEEGIPFHLTMVGGGECEEEMKAFVKEKGLEEKVAFFDFLAPKEVREKMNRADVFLFTSDFREGWGAVVNEAMSGGCAVIASHAAGAVPFLIRHKENGLIYESGNVADLTDDLRTVLTDRAYREKIGDAAYKTIADEWNPECAGKRLVNLCKAVLSGDVAFEKSGPLSEAEAVLEKKMYAHIMGENK